MTINKFTYHENKSSKKLLFEVVGGLHFYIAEDFDENYLVKTYIRKKHGRFTYVLKDARGRLLCKYETY